MGINKEERASYYRDKNSGHGNLIKDVFKFVVKKLKKKRTKIKER